MRVALIVPGFSADEADWCIPALLNFARALAQRVELEIFTLRYPHRRDRYRIGNAAVYSLGWAQRRGPHSPRLWWSAIQAIRTRHREAPFDCLHAIWADEPGWIGAVCAQQLGLPLVVSLAGGELSRLPVIDYGLQRHQFQGRFIHWTLARANLVTAGSRYMLDLARPHVLGSQRLVLAPLGVDRDRFAPAHGAANEGAGASKTEPKSSISLPELHVRNEPLQMINVGSLAAVKGHALLLRAMRHVADELPESRLRIVGEGPLQSALRRQVAELELTRQVTLDGAVDHAQLPHMYRTADLFVQTSLHEAEGMAVLEAAACGLAAVGTGVGVLPELAERGAGMTTPADDRALAAAVLTLLRDPMRRVRMAHAARTAILDFYCVDTCVTRFIEGYSAIAARRLPS